MKTERSAVPGDPDKLSERRGDDDQEGRGRSRWRPMNREFGDTSGGS